MLVHDVAGWNTLDRTALHRPARATGVLMCPPDHFDVVDVRNVHMEGRAGTVDRVACRREWEELAAALTALGLRVERLDPAPGLVDMVFTANPCLIGVDRDGEEFAVLSRMRHPGRAAEVDHHEAWLRARGIRCHRIPDAIEGGFEGGGDGVWLPDHYLLFGGVGPRSDGAVFAWLSEELALPVCRLELIDPAFYHLDTCLVPLDARRAAWVPAAFDTRGQALIRAAFDQLVTVDDTEARERLAGNLYSPDGRRVLLPAGAPRTRSALEAAGLVVREVRTDEFLKSGGSIYCLRQELF